ncbi:MAG: hypothetical protein KAT32_01695 [Candidatus Moranbacteria bacterium]|nr:hypothetical protein [Candidatus Moranbacteria bacterium]
MKKYSNLLRWLSILPSIFTIIAFSDYLVRFFIWLTIFPLKLRRIGNGPIGVLFDNISNFLFGVDSDMILYIIFTAVITGLLLVYCISILIPIENKFVAKFLLYFYMIITVLFLVAFLIVGDSEAISVYEIIRKIAGGLIFVLGIFIGFYSIKDMKSDEIEIIDIIVNKSIKYILLATTLFTLFIYFIVFIL